MLDSDARIPARLRAMGLWARCWQLAGGVWPPQSRAIAHQIVLMVRNYLVEVSNGRYTHQQAFQRARQALDPLTAQRFYPGSEQDIAVDLLTEAILDAEIGDLPGDETAV